MKRLMLAVIALSSLSFAGPVEEVKTLAVELEQKAAVLYEAVQPYKESDVEVETKLYWRVHIYQSHVRNFKNNIYNNADKLGEVYDRNFEKVYEQLRMIRSYLSSVTVVYPNVEESYRAVSSVIDGLFKYYQTFPRIPRPRPQPPVPPRPNPQPPYPPYPNPNPYPDYFDEYRAKSLARDLQFAASRFLQVARANAENTSRARRLLNDVVRLEAEIRQFSGNAQRNRLTRNLYAQMFRNVEGRFNNVSRRVDDLGRSPRIYRSFQHE